MYAYPNRQDLITCFLKANYAGRTAIVFCDVLGDCSRPARLQKLFDLATGRAVGRWAFFRLSPASCLGVPVSTPSTSNVATASASASVPSSEASDRRIINSEVFIVADQTAQFFSLTIKEEIYGFAMFWDGMKIVSENS